MNGAKFRLVGVGLLSSALAVGCSGDDGASAGSGDSGGGGSGNTTATTSPVTTTISNVANNVSSASSSQSANSSGSSGSGTSTGAGTGSTGSGTGTGSTTSGAGSNSGTTGAASSNSGSASSSTGSTSSTAATSSSTSSTGSTSGTTGSTTASTSGSTTASTSGSTTASTSGSTTGSGGTGGTSCDDPAPPVGSTGEGGAAGSDGGDWNGFNFVDDSELDEWSILSCGSGATNCVDDDAATLSFSCGVLEVEIDWPASANTQATRLQLQNVVPLDMLRDLSGKTLYARVRMTSAAVADHGYDFNVIAQDFIDDADDSNDWKWFSTCYNGSGDCPDNPSGETYAMGTWVELALPMLEELAPDEFAFDSVRKLAFEIGTKYWEAGEPFNYDDAPATFEIDYVAW